MKFKGTFLAPRIDLEKYRTTLQAALLEHLTLAAFEWLNATAAQIPQWSGASAATFLHLARRISYSLPITQAGSAPNRVGLGMSEGDGDFILDPGKGQFSFFYRTTLAHLIYNEFNNANVNPDPTLFSFLHNPGPYHFQQRGRLAFLRVAADARLPNPFNSVTKIKVG